MLECGLCGNGLVWRKFRNVLVECESLWLDQRENPLRKIELDGEMESWRRMRKYQVLFSNVFSINKYFEQFRSEKLFGLYH